MSASLFGSFVALAVSFISLYFVITIRDNNAQSNFVALERSLRQLESDVSQTQSNSIDLASLIGKNQTYNNCLSNTSNTCSQLTKDIQYTQNNLTYIKTLENINMLYLMTNLSCSIGITTLQTKIAGVSANSNTNQVVQQGTFQITLDGIYNTSSTYLIQKLNMNGFQLYYTIYKGGWPIPPPFSPSLLVFHNFVPPISGCNDGSISLGKRTLLEFQSFGGAFGSVERFCDNDRLVFYGTGGVFNQSIDFIKI
jgi:hypothetical protein